MDHNFCSGLQRQDKLLLWCESPPIHLASLCTLAHFWHPWVGSQQNTEEKNPEIWFGKGSCDRSWPSLKLPSLVVPGGKWLPFSQVGGMPTSEKEPHWWHINRVPDNVTRMWLTQTKWFVLFLARAFVPTLNDWIWSFSSQPLISCQWLPNQSDLGYETSEVNSQIEAPTDMPPQSAKDLWELEALGSSPSHSPSWSLARRVLSSHPNTKHCLEIHVTLTEELGAVLPPSHFGWHP